MIALSLPNLDDVLGQIGGAGDKIVADSLETLRSIAEELRDAAAAHLAASASADATGALASSLAVESGVEDGAPVARMSSDLPYAAVQEYGFEGVVSVAEHLRHVRAAFGRPLEGERLARVRAHARRMVVPAKRFLGQAVDDLQRSKLGARR